MGHRPTNGLVRYVEPLLPALLESGIAVEINTSGLDFPAQEFMPGWELIEILAEAGVSLTLGPTPMHRIMLGGTSLTL